MNHEKYKFTFKEISCETWLQARRLCERLDFYMKEAGRNPEIIKRADVFILKCADSEYIFKPRLLCREGYSPDAERETEEEAND